MYLPARSDLGDYDSFGTMLRFLARSPALRKLTLDCEEPGMTIYGPTAEATAQLPHLQDVIWPGAAHGFGYLTGTVGDADGVLFPSIRRLVVKALDWRIGENESLTGMCTLPALEIIYLDSSLKDVLPEIPIHKFTRFSKEHMTPHLIDPSFASWIHRQPLVRHIHSFRLEPNSPSLTFVNLDAIEKRGEFTSSIRSLRHEKEEHELLHVRTLVMDILVAEMESHMSSRVEPDEVVRGEWRRIIYTSGDQSDVQTFSFRQEEPVWIDMTEYRGCVVPQEIVYMMRKEESVGAEDDWGRRGVEVGVKGWKVLTDWYEALTSGIYPFAPVDSDGVIDS